MQLINSLLGRFISGLCVFLVCTSVVQGATLSLLFSQEHWHYKEVDDFNFELNREQGALPQLHAELLVPIKPRWTLTSELNYNKGTLNYIGTTQAGSPHTTRTDTANFFVLTSLRYNWHNWYLGCGLQYQYWQREIKAANNVSQLHEYYRWYGPQLELGYTYKPTNYLQFELGLNASWLNGNLLVDLTNIPTTRGGTRNFGKPKIKLTDGYAAKTFLLAKIQLNKQVDLIFKYQLGYRYFPKSATTSATDGTLNLRIHEPESSNNFYYYGTGLSYKNF